MLKVADMNFVFRKEELFRKKKTPKATLDVFSIEDLYLQVELFFSYSIHLRCAIWLKTIQ